LPTVFGIAGTFDIPIEQDPNVPFNVVTFGGIIILAKFISTHEKNVKFILTTLFGIVGAAASVAHE
jgi:hypothetical protein